MKQLNNDRIANEIRTQRTSDKFNEIISLADDIRDIETKIKDINTDVNKLWSNLSSQLISSKHQIGEMNTKYNTIYIYLYQNGIGWGYTSSGIYKNDRIQKKMNFVHDIRHSYYAENMTVCKVLDDEMAERAIDILNGVRGNDKGVIIEEFRKFIKRGVLNTNDIFIFETKYNKTSSPKVVKLLDKGIKPYEEDMKKVQTIQLYNNINYPEIALITKDMDNIKIQLDNKNDIYLYEQVQDNIKEHLENLLKNSKEWLSEYIRNYTKLQEGLKDYIIQEEMKEMKI